MRQKPLFTALLLVFALVATPALADDKPTEPSTDKPSSEGPSEDAPAAPVTDPKLADQQAKIQQIVDDLRPVVAAMRGLAWKRPVKAAVMTRDDLYNYLLSELEKETTPEEWDRDTRILQRVGFLAQDENLKEMALEMYKTAVAGFYNPKTGNIFVIDGVDAEGQKPTLVHELIHAIEDQHYDLDGMEKPHRENDPDRQFAIRCLWEGSAEWGRRQFENMEPAIAQHAEKVKRANPGNAAQMAMMQKTPTYMLLSTLLHYRTGPNFVQHQYRRYGYADGMQKLFEDPPTTQEQVLHPHKWLGPHRDYPRTVVWGGDLAKTLGENWKTLHEHSIGELDLAIFLDFWHGDANGKLNLQEMGLGRFVDLRSNAAARGWDAGRAVFVENADKHIVFAQAFAFDSAKDAEEAGRLLAEASRKAAGDAWKGEGWQSDEAAAGQHMAYDYRNQYGRGRVLIRGQEVLVLDGVPDAEFDKAWAAVEKTTFTQDSADKGDIAADPFEGFDIVDHRRGLGLKLPEGWTATAGGRSPAAFATARKDGVQVAFTVVGQPAPESLLGSLGKAFLGQMFDMEKTMPTSIMGTRGLKHPLPVPPSMHGELHFASDLARTFIVTVVGPKDAVGKLADDIQRMLDGMPGPLAAPEAPGDLEATSGAPAGLRSIPGY